MEELVKMSPKGQLVVPVEIREKEKFKPSDRFVAFSVNGGVLFKRIRIPDIKAEFESLSAEIAEQLKKGRVAETEVEEAVKWARQKRL